MTSCGKSGQELEVVEQRSRARLNGIIGHLIPGANQSKSSIAVGTTSVQAGQKQVGWGLEYATFRMGLGLQRLDNLVDLIRIVSC